MSSIIVSSKGVKSTEGEAIESCFRRATRLSIPNQESQIPRWRESTLFRALGIAQMLARESIIVAKHNRRGPIFGLFFKQGQVRVRSNPTKSVQRSPATVHSQVYVDLTPAEQSTVYIDQIQRSKLFCDFWCHLDSDSRSVSSNIGNTVKFIRVL